MYICVYMYISILVNIRIAGRLRHGVLALQRVSHAHPCLIIIGVS